MAGSAGSLWHVNCHSMRSVSNHMSPDGPGIARRDFILGDLDGMSCASEFTALVRDALADPVLTCAYGSTVY